MQRFSSMKTQTASNRTPRKINSNLVFNLVRIRQPISRADLARASGLQRSTISLIIEDLIQSGWIVEGALDQTARGRRPTSLKINSKRVILALDIHPAQTTMAVIDVVGNIITQQIVVMPEEPTKAVNAIVRASQRIIADHISNEFVGIGICVPGRIDLHLQKLIFAPNLNWPVLSLKTSMERATGLHVEMDNVANACALSEVWFGSSDGAHDLVVVNVAEGIGTGIFANGRLLRGESGMAGEFGHVQLHPDGLLCSCGNRGCWETLASNYAAVRYYIELSATDSFTRKPSFDTLLKLSQTGDETACHAVRKMAVHLGAGIRMIAVALSPREIVVVGDITSVWHLFGAVIESEMRKDSLTKGAILRPSSGGNTARLRSAVALVLGDALSRTDN